MRIPEGILGQEGVNKDAVYCECQLDLMKSGLGRISTVVQSVT
jgi:hypothetical protein